MLEWYEASLQAGQLYPVRRKLKGRTKLDICQVIYREDTPPAETGIGEWPLEIASNMLQTAFQCFGLKLRQSFKLVAPTFIVHLRND